MDIEKLIRPHLIDVKTYSAIDPPEALAERAGIPQDEIIKLNANENPFGPSPNAVEAVARAPLHVYPDPLQRRIRKALSGYCGIGPECLIAGAGSDELIDLLFRLFISQGDAIIDSDPTFGMYGFCARISGADTVMVPRTEDFDVDVDEVARAARRPGAKIIFVSSPNNPTGNAVSEEQVKALLDTGLVVVIDEAYFEFSRLTVAGLVPEYENLVVLRTMSKWAGLAGLRVGYGLMSPRLVRHIMDIKPPYNVNIAAEAALIASLEHADALLERVQVIVDERARMFGLLGEIPGVSPWPSYGNFILCSFAPGVAGPVYDGLAARGIFVRRFSTQRLADTFRITVGSPKETDAVIVAMRDLVPDS
jgi:histidinol-phosphate aminotransferase